MAEKALKGKVVLLLRPNLGREAKKLRALGAKIVHSSVLKLCPTLYPIPYTLYPFRWIVFTSSSAVHFFKKRCEKLPASLKIAAIGPKTAQAVSELFKRKIDFMPSVYTTEALAKKLPLGDAAAGTDAFSRLRDSPHSGTVPEKASVPNLAAAPASRILLVRSEIADKRLETILSKRGASFTRVSPYTVKENGLKAQVKRDLVEGRISCVFFGSASQVRSFAGNFTTQKLRKIFRRNKTIALAIGPETSKALKKLGIPHKVSSQHTFDGLIDLLAER